MFARGRKKKVNFCAENDLQIWYEEMKVVIYRYIVASPLRESWWIKEPTLDGYTL